MKDARISFGMLFSSAGVGAGVVSAGSSSGASVVAVSGSGVGAYRSRINLGIFISISGFFVRTIIVAVAAYIGIAASINMPNTNPANPRSCACINMCQYRSENISKLNSMRKIAHMTVK